MSLLYRQINILNKKEHTAENDSPGWFEYVDDLWSENKLSHLREASEPQVYNPATERYGFQINEESTCTGDETGIHVDLYENEDETKEDHPKVQLADKLPSTEGIGI